MVVLIRHYFSTIDLTSYITIPLLICLGYTFYIPPTFLFVVTVISLPIIIYFVSNKNKVDLFLISLPVRKHTIIKSRYLFSVLMAAVILLLQMLVMYICTVMFDGTQYVYDLRDVCILLCLAAIGPSILIPIYHLFRSFILATAIGGIVFFIGLFLMISQLIDVLGMVDYIIFNDLDPGLSMVVEKFIPFQPYLILIITSISILLISMVISQRLYSFKDYKR